jgi:hypothetical protein
MKTVNVTPTDLAGGGSTRALSPEAQDIVDRLKDYYRGIGKPSAAQNYCRHLRAFFAWSEAQGYSVHSLPAAAVEDFLSSLTAAGQKETTVYVMRTQLRTALREAHAALGLDFAHLEYETGKPKAVRDNQKAKERAKKLAAREENEAARSEAIAAASAAYASVYAPQPPEPYAPADPLPYEEAYPMSDPRDPPALGAAPATAPQPPPASNTPTVVVMNAPAQPAAGRATISQRTATAPAAATPARGVLISNHIFTGPYIRISRIADGSDPLSLPGSESIIQTVSAAHILAHGDISSYLQQWTLPSVALKSGVTTLNLVFHELNEKKQPTGRRDELSFNVPPGGFGAAGAVGAVGAPVAAVPMVAAAPAPSFDRATEYLLKKLDSDAESAKRKVDELQEQLRKSDDARTTFMLSQQMQAAQDMKRELEDRKEREMMRALAPPPAPAPAFPPMPPAGLAGLGFLEPQPPKPDTTAEMVKALAEQQAKTFEVMAAAMRPQPVQPQKDVAEWLVPFIAQMNQQAQAQAQAQQTLMMTLMQQQQQQSQQFMQMMMGKESSTEKLLMMQLQEVKAAAAAPKGDEVEDFAEKLQKMQAVTQMLGGGSSSNFLADLLQNADSIGAGAAQIIAAAKGAKTEAPTPKVVRAEQQQLAAPPSAGALPAAPAAPIEPPKPTQGMLDAHAAFLAALETRNEQDIADGFVKLMVELSTAQEPYVTMARRILAIFAEAEEEADLYEAAKALWTAVGKPVFRPSAKLAAKVFAKWYSPLHKAFFDVEKTLPSLADAEESAAPAGAVVQGDAGADEQGDDGEEGDEDEDDDEEEVA